MKKRLQYILIVFLIFNIQKLPGQSSWYQLNSGTTVHLKEIYFPTTNIGYAISDYDSVLLKTSDQGLNWSQTQLIDDDGGNAIYFLNPDTGFVAGNSGKIHKTTNGGADFIIYRVSNNLFDESNHDIVFPSYDTGYVSTKYGKIYKSVNGGVNWINQRTGATFFFELSFVNNQTGYCTGWGQGWNLLRTTNGGTNWDSLSAIPAADYYGNFFINSQTGILAGIAGSNTGVITKTTDSGNSWTLKYSDPTMRFFSVFFVNSNIGFAVGYGTQTKILKTTDGGENWISDRSPLYWGLLSVFFTNELTGYVVGLNGKILKTTDGGTVDIEPINNEIPVSFDLKQNFPNPFNPTTVIRFALPVESIVNIKVYDVNGKLIADLINNKSYQPGFYDVSFDAANYNLSSGIYFYKLTTNNFFETKKMVLLK